MVYHLFCVFWALAIQNVNRSSRSGDLHETSCGLPGETVGKR